MSVSTVSPQDWYTYDESGLYLCGTCVLADLQRTAKGELTGDEAVTLAKIEKLSADVLEIGVQCDNCLEQTDNYGEDDNET